jgi:hypothetical protein
MKFLDITFNGPQVNFLSDALCSVIRSVQSGHIEL